MAFVRVRERGRERFDDVAAGSGGGGGWGPGERDTWRVDWCVCDDEDVDATSSFGFEDDALE